MEEGGRRQGGKGREKTLSLKRTLNLENSYQNEKGDLVNSDLEAKMLQTREIHETKI